MSDLPERVLLDVATLKLVREHLAGRHNETVHETCLGCDYIQLYAAYGQAVQERDALRQAILDIDAHATPYGDIPDEPGYVGTYLLTAGALHRALGKIGHTAPKCQAEAELEQLRAQLATVTGERDDALQMAETLRTEIQRLNAALDHAQNRPWQTTSDSGSGS